MSAWQGCAPFAPDRASLSALERCRGRDLHGSGRVLYAGRVNEWWRRRTIAWALEAGRSFDAIGGEALSEVQASPRPRGNTPASSKICMVNESGTAYSRSACPGNLKERPKTNSAVLTGG